VNSGAILLVVQRQDTVWVQGLRYPCSVVFAAKSQLTIVGAAVTSDSYTSGSSFNGNVLKRDHSLLQLPWRLSMQSMTSSTLPHFIMDWR
jgi:hypothetical protein